MSDMLFYTYYLKGSRNYVQGATLFESFCHVLNSYNMINFEIKSLKFHRELHHHGSISLMPTPLKTNEIANTLIASMIVTHNNQFKYLYLFDEINSTITEKREDMTEKYINQVNMLDTFTSKNQIHNITNFPDLVMSLVELNKQTHRNTLKDQRSPSPYRWVSLDKLSVNLSSSLPEKLTVNITPVGQKKTKNNTVFTLNQAAFSLNGTLHQPLIGFSYPELPLT